MGYRADSQVDEGEVTIGFNAQIKSARAFFRAGGFVQNGGQVSA